MHLVPIVLLTHIIVCVLSVFCLRPIDLQESIIRILRFASFDRSVGRFWLFRADPYDQKTGIYRGIPHPT